MSAAVQLQTTEIHEMSKEANNNKYSALRISAQKAKIQLKQHEKTVRHTQSEA